MFEAAGVVTPGTSSGLVRQRVDWNGTTHFYYQSNRSLNAFYYMPDTFKLARRPEPPHQPILSVRLTRQTDRAKRSSVSVLRRHTGGEPRAIDGSIADNPHLHSGRARGGTDRAGAAAPRSEGHASELGVPGLRQLDRAVRPATAGSVDLRSGVVDSISNLTIDQFDGLYDALFSTGQLAFTGNVTLDLGNDGESIPFKLRIFDTAEPLASWTETTEGDTVIVALKNEVESPLRLHRVDAIATEAANLTVKPLTPADGTLPIELAPAASTRFSLTPASGIDINGLDLSDVETVPDRITIHDLILDPTTRPSFMRPITVKTFPPTFAPPTDAPARQVLEVIVEFDDGNAVALTRNRARTDGAGDHARRQLRARESAAPGISLQADSRYARTVP